MLCLNNKNYGIGEFAAVRSASQAVRAIRYDFPVTASGSAGAVNIWVEGGWYQYEFMRFYMTLQRGSAKTKRALRQTLESHWPILTDWEAR